MLKIYIWVCLLLTFLSSQHLRAADELQRIGSANQFRLPSIDGELVEPFASDQTELTVVCFLGTECPLAKLYGPRLQKLADEYAGRNLEFIGVCSNLQDSLEEVRQYGRQHGLSFKMLKDTGNKVADAYGASRTTEVYLLDRSFQIRYQGRIDDQYQPGLVKPEPTRQDLRLALDELLAGKSVSKPRTIPVGCLLGRVPQVAVKTDLTFTNEIYRLLDKNCIECHRTGEIGPFALTDYDEVIGWGEMLVEVVDQGRMPPWHASPAYGHFQNAREMADEEKQMLREWVAGGMPFGDQKDLPPPREFDPVWQLEREPELVVNIGREPFQVPGEGVVEYQYFVVDPGFTEDKWVTGVQVVPGNRSVVHHCIVFIRPPDGTRFQGVGWLGGYVPGQKPLPMRAGYGRFVPAGSKLVFQMHYTPTGTPQEDATKLGLIFGSDAEITHEVITVMGINQDFEIPPNTPDYVVTGLADRFPQNGELLGMTPHMHLRGQSFEVTLESDSGLERVLEVPHYDFNWQHFYLFENPRSLQDINKIRFSATFDNSVKNPVNPDPQEHVSWGDQTWQEMAVAFFAIAKPRGSDSRSKSIEMERQQLSAQELQTRTDQFVQNFFAKFDLNRDQKIVREELPIALRTFGFKKFNTDKDDHLSPEEISKLVAKELKQTLVQ